MKRKATAKEIEHTVLVNVMVLAKAFGLKQVQQAVDVIKAAGEDILKEGAVKKAMRAPRRKR